MAYSVGEMRVEMGRLTQIMLTFNAKYLVREKELEQLYGNQPHVLSARRDDDYLLNKASGTAKTCAVLITALAAVISAEIAWAEHHRE